jgi:hypothetical protein
MEVYMQVSYYYYYLKVDQQAEWESSTIVPYSPQTSKRPTGGKGMKRKKEYTYSVQEEIKSKCQTKSNSMKRISTDTRLESVETNATKNQTIKSIPKLNHRREI